MRLPWPVVLATLAMATCALGQTPRLGNPIQPVGYLVPAAPAENKVQQAVAYQPRPGDIILCDDFNRFFHVLFRMASTAPPTHAAMVIARADGTPVLLDLTGPHTLTAKVIVHDIEPRLKNYPGVVMIRRIREPLTTEQTVALRTFAEKESGKSFALPRVVLMGTPFCARTGLRKELFGKTYLTRDRWFCSEMVVAACVTAGILDGKRCCANATYPRDLAVDEMLDLSRIYHPDRKSTRLNSSHVS